MSVTNAPEKLGGTKKPGHLREFFNLATLFFNAFFLSSHVTSSCCFAALRLNGTICTYTNADVASFYALYNDSLHTHIRKAKRVGCDDTGGRVQGAAR